MNFEFPGASLNTPRPKGSVIGPPKMKMPETAGDMMPRSQHQFPHSALGFQTKLLPQNPMAPLKAGTVTSLLGTDGRGASGLHGIKKRR